MSRTEDYERISPSGREAWRSWLRDNHDSSPGVWVIYFKKAAEREGISYDDAVEEALCFGWIDSRVRSIDGDRYRQLYTPRRRGSVWSRLNKERVERMIEAGKMTGAGVDKVEAARADGSWDLLEAVDGLVVPDDLRRALAAKPGAAKNFDEFSSSEKKPMLWWVYSAKRDTTRSGRVAAIVAAAAEGLTVEQHRIRRPGRGCRR